MSKKKKKKNNHKVKHYRVGMGYKPQIFDERPLPSILLTHCRLDDGWSEWN